MTKIRAFHSRESFTSNQSKLVTPINQSLGKTVTARHGNP
jgi:hypothetical protein